MLNIQMPANFWQEHVLEHSMGKEQFAPKKKSTGTIGYPHTKEWSWTFTSYYRYKQTNKQTNSKTNLKIDQQPNYKS